MKYNLFRFASSPALISLVGAVLAGVGIANAQIGAPTLPDTATTLDTSLFCPVVNIMFWVLISISIIIVLWAAYLYVISEGESERPSQARKMLLYAAIGIVLALVAKGFPEIVGSLFGSSAGSTEFSLAC
jgi:fructose-specific phosphotransferase system IIC component